jgi:hypothetical protein
MALSVDHQRRDPLIRHSIDGAQSASPKEAMATQVISPLLLAMTTIGRNYYYHGYLYFSIQKPVASN